MDCLKYKSIVYWTLTQRPPEKNESSLDVARRILSNLKVPFPKGKLNDVVRKIGSRNYMGWRWHPFSAMQAQQCVNSDYVVIGIGIDDNNRITIILPEDSAVPLDNTLPELPNNFYARPLSSITLGEIQQMQFFAFVDFKF